MNSLNEIRSFGERFRNILYLVVSVAVGYLILVKFLSILDAESIGLSWLANNPNNAFVIIFVFWLFLILAVDLIIDLVYSRGRAKAISIPQVQGEKPVPVEGQIIAGLIGDIKEAQAPGSKKTKWPYFLRKEDKTNITSRSPEDKRKIIGKREIGEKKRELKGGTIKKEALERLETRPEISELTKKIIGKTAKGKTARTKIFEEPKQIMEPADNIQSTDMAAISVKKGSRFREAFDGEHHVSVIDFTPSISRKKTMIRIEKLKATSQLAEEIPPNIIFENFNIWVNIPEKDIGEPVIVFRVDKSWVAENNLGEVQLYKYMDHEWVLQGPAEKLDEDGGYFYFQTPLKGLSGFYAIVGI